MSTTCPYCRGPFQIHDAMMTCQACATPHHKDCFLENGGCTVFGCVNAPGDEPKISIRIQDLEGDFPSRPNENAAAYNPAPAPAWQRGQIPAVRPFGSYVANADEADALRVTPRFGIAREREYPYPPNLPWALVVIFTILTSGLFQVIWDLTLALWLRKVQPRSRAIYYYSMVVILELFVVFAGVTGMATKDREASATALCVFGVIVFKLMGRFSMRKSLQSHFDEAGPVGLWLSEGMTFFFGSVYFQYHLNRILKQKERRQAIA